MIFGIGVDVTQMERFQNRPLEGSFCRRVYAPEEREWLEKRKGRAQVEGLAGCWAAKEAFLKAAGTGLSGFTLEEITLGHEASGAPRLRLTGRAGQWMERNGLTAHVSVSHDGGLCTAFVVLEVQGKGEKSP